MGSGEGRANRPRSRHCDRPNAVSQATLPCCRDCAFRERRRGQVPHGSLVGLFCCPLLMELNRSRSSVNKGTNSRTQSSRTRSVILCASNKHAPRTTSSLVGALLLPILWFSFLPTGSATQTNRAPNYRQVTDEIGRTIRIPQPIRRV